MERLSDSYDCYIINDKLTTLYGRHEETNKPRFRVVHSDDQLEKRFGNFTVSTENGIYLRTETNVVRQVPKYCNGLLENQWVVERLQPNETEDVIEGDFIYECLWAFPAGLPLNYEMVEFVVKKALNILPDDVMKNLEGRKTRKQYEDDHKDHLKRESARLLNMMDRTATQSLIAEGAGITVPSSYKSTEEKVSE